MSELSESLVEKERARQATKWSLEHDIAEHGSRFLADAAAYLINPCPSPDVAPWLKRLREKHESNLAQRYAIAAAWMYRAIDCLCYETGVESLGKSRGLAQPKPMLKFFRADPMALVAWHAYEHATHKTITLRWHCDLAPEDPEWSLHVDSWIGDIPGFTEFMPLLTALFDTDGIEASREAAVKVLEDQGYVLNQEYGPL